MAILAGFKPVVANATYQGKPVSRIEVDTKGRYWLRDSSVNSFPAGDAVVAVLESDDPWLTSSVETHNS